MNTKRLVPNDLTQEERNKLVEDNMGLVFLYVNKMCNKPQLFDDCVQEGCLGLMRASKYWTGTHKGQPVKFTTFAGFEIRCSINDFLFENKLIKLPDWQRKGLTDYYKAVEKMEKQHVEISSDILVETAKKFGLTQETFDVIQHTAVSLNTPIESEESSTELQHLIPDKTSQEDVVENIAFEQMIEFIKDFASTVKSVKPEYVKIFNAHLEDVINEALGKESVSFLDRVRQHYPEFNILPEDNKETIEYKKRQLDNKYVSINDMWLRNMKKLRPMLVEAGFATSTL